MNKASVGNCSRSFRICRRCRFSSAIQRVVGIYIVLGGLRAAAITDAVQGLLILVMSLMLIPVGLHRIGGFAGLHRDRAGISVQRHGDNGVAFDFGDHVCEPGADHWVAAQHVDGGIGARTRTRRGLG